MVWSCPPLASQALALLSSAFWVHASWALPLALFGLVTAASPLITALMPHFLALWIASIALDVFWLSWRASEARSVVVFMTGVSMVFKVVSAGAAARILQAQGALPDVGGAGGGFGAGGFGGARQPWLSGGTTAPFGLPGSWSGQGASCSCSSRGGDVWCGIVLRCSDESRISGTRLRLSSTQARTPTSLAGMGENTSHHIRSSSSAAATRLSMTSKRRQRQRQARAMRLRSAWTTLQARSHSRLRARLPGSAPASLQMRNVYHRRALLEI